MYISQENMNENPLIYDTQNITDLNIFHVCLHMYRNIHTLYRGRIFAVGHFGVQKKKLVSVRLG